MKRHQIQPRQDWQKKVEALGFMFHTSNGQPYWNESVYYEFTTQEVDAIEKATYKLDEMMLMAVGYVIDNRKLSDLAIPEKFHKMIIESWERDEISIYGRFDLAWNDGDIKLIEYNADTPTSLLESSVVQWYWLQELFKDRDQFNSIHERLVEAWIRVRDEYQQEFVHFASIANFEDLMTVTYLRDTAQEAGISTDQLSVKDIGWNEEAKEWRDVANRNIKCLFKLYPWEFMTNETFGENLLVPTKTRFLEPAWKMILSNKGILPLLYKLFGKSPYILEASTSAMSGSYVKKPFLSREGANIEIKDDDGEVVSTQGNYGEPFVYQRPANLIRLDDKFGLIGSWLVNGHACGMGIREDNGPITANTSQFVPHLF